MGIVIPFTPRRKPTTPVARAVTGPFAHVEEAVVAAAATGATYYDVLDAAAGLLALCRDRYGFTVMNDGLPREPDELADVLVTLLRGLTLLDDACGGKRSFPGYGVYFGRPRLAWFEDGCGGRTGLAVPNRASAEDLAAFVRPRLESARR